MTSSWWAAGRLDQHWPITCPVPGLKIAVMDKEDFPRQKVCAGWVTPAVMQELNIDLEDYARGRELQAIHGFRISQLGQKQVQFPLFG